MTFLELVRRTCEECGVKTDSLATVTDQTGELKRMVNWVSDAWFMIQAKHQDWRFLRTTASWQTVAGQPQYTTLECGIAAGTFGRWLPDTFRNYLTEAASAWGSSAWGSSPYGTGTSGGGYPTEIYMQQVPFEDWRNLWLFGANRTVTSRPLQVAVTPNDGIALGPAPLVGYTVYGDYNTAPVRLVADADQHALPIKHSDMIIVYKAMMDYGAYWVAADVYGRGERGYKSLMAALEIDQLPPMHFAGALA